MKKVQILGTGCAKCNQLADNAAAAIAANGGEYELVKITQINEIMEFGVMMTPGLAVDGDVKSVGKVLSAGQIGELL